MKRIPHILKSNCKSESMRHLLFVDTETEKIYSDERIEKQKLKLGCAIYCRYDKNNYVQRICLFTSHEEFYKFFESILKPKTTLYVFAHNLAFDFAVLELDRYLIENKWKDVFISCGNRQVILKFRKDQTSVVFLDTLNYLNFSVDTLGQHLGLPKLKIDFNNCTIEELKEYCKRDTEIIAYFMKSFFDFVKKNDLGSKGLTLAQQAFKAFRHRFMKEKIYIHNHAMALKLEIDSYFGGRCECFKLGKIDGKVYKLDVNSMYPYVMKSYKYPVKLIGYFPDRTDVNFVSSLLKKYLVIARVIVNTDEPVYPKRDSGKLIFPVGEFETVLCTESLSYAIKHNHIKEIKEIAWYEGKRIFKDYVDFFTSIKDKASESGDKVTRLLAKLFLNSLYGKFGQRIRDCIVLERKDVEIDGEIPSRYVISGKGEYIVYPWLDKVYLFGNKKEVSFDAFPAIASHITDNARMYLYGLIKIANNQSKSTVNGNVYYVDTDSLFVSEDGYRNLIGYIDENRTGFLKLEDVTDNLVINGPKDYVWSGIEKLKGIKKTATRINDITFEQIVFPNMSKVLKRRQRESIELMKITKVLRRDYNKGYVRKDGWIEPFEFLLEPTEDILCGLGQENP